MDDLLLKRRPKKFVQQRKAIQTLTMAEPKTVTNLADCAIKKSDKPDGLQRDADGRIIIKSSGAIREDFKSISR